MVIDLFYILHELDLMELRLSILDKYVDKFIVVEANETFSGVPKQMVFDINDKRWAKWRDKIQHYQVTDFPLDTELYRMAYNSPCTGNREHYWIREFYLKESARKALQYYDDNDIVFISDCDEVWNPKLTYNPVGDEVLKPKQTPYLYYLNQRTDEDWLGWSGTVCCRNETIRNGIINHIRTDELQKYTVLENGGWHWNSIGGADAKRRAFNHPVYENKVEWDRREVNPRKDNSNLPEEIKSWKKYLL